MDRKKYIEKLEDRNGYCECPELRDFLDKRREATELEAKCDFFSGNVDLDDAKADDSSFLLDYKTTVEKMKTSIRRYKEALSDEIKSGNLQLIIHDYINPMLNRAISHSTAIEFQKTGELNILTAHCFRCNQQIDVVSG
jgi:hypothetical protein